MLYIEKFCVGGSNGVQEGIGGQKERRKSQVLRLILLNVGLITSS